MNSPTKFAPPSAETQSILDSIRRIVRALRCSARTAEKSLGLSGAQVYVLRKLSEGGTVSLNELAERTLTHQSTVSSVVSQLVEKGLVVRAPSRSDARRIELSLSPSGVEFVGRAPKAPQENIVAALERLSENERHDLARLMYKVITDAGMADQPASLMFDDEETLPGFQNLTSRKNG